MVDCHKNPEVTNKNPKLMIFLQTLNAYVLNGSDMEQMPGT